MASDVLRLYGFALESVEPDLIQTDWRYQAGGSIRDRALVRVRARGNRYFLGTLRVEVEEARDGGGWRPVAVSGDLRQEYADIRKEVRERLRPVMTQ